MAISLDRNSAELLGRTDMDQQKTTAAGRCTNNGGLFRVLALALCGVLLAACASESRTRTPIPGQESAPWPGSAEYQNKFGDTIPEPLMRAMQNAYAVPEPFDCDTLVTEVQALESVLGEDLDSRAGAPVDENILAGVLVSAVNGLVPYRGWLMRLSGETKRLRLGVAAIAAGCVRRAYLKGLGQSQGCPLPAKPKRPQ